MEMKREESGRLLGAIGVLFGLGVIYNLAVDWLGRNGYVEGYASILVVGGTAVVLIFALPLIGLKAFVQLLALFAAAGAPMAMGSMQRYASKRRQFAERLRGH